MDLFGGDASEEDEKLEVNKEFAEQYESRKRKQALQKANIAAPSHSPISAAGSQDLACAPYSAYGFNFETSEPSTSFSPWQTNVIAVR